MSETYQTSVTLLEALRYQNNEQAWERFIKYYERFIYSSIRKMSIAEHEALELTQAVIVKIWRKFPDFNYRQNNGKFRNWLFTVTRNLTLNYLEKQSGKVRLLDNYSHGQTEVVESFDWIEKEWRNYLANEAFNRIRPSLSEKSIAIYLGLVRGESADSLAEKHGLERNTVYVYKKRITERLAAEISRLEELMP